MLYLQRENVLEITARYIRHSLYDCVRYFCRTIAWDLLDSVICTKFRMPFHLIVPDSETQQECIPEGCVPPALVAASRNQYLSRTPTVQADPPPFGGISPSPSEVDHPQKEYRTRQEVTPPGKNMRPNRK